MNLRTISRTSGALAAVVSVVAAGMLVLAPGASGLDQERVTLKENETQVIDYFALIGNNPGANVDASTTISPDICTTPNTSCDVIPLTVPDPGHEDDFFVTITLEWDTAEIPNVPLYGDATVNDLDLWIVDDPFNPEAGPDEDGFRYHSASLNRPEKVQMYRPIGNFHLIVVNAAGVNTGYTMTYSWATDPLPTIFESLPPEFSGAPVRPPAPPAAPAAPPAPAPAPVEESAPAPAPIESTAAAPDLSVGASGLPDSSFSSGFGDAPSLDDELAAPPPREFRRTAVVKPPPPSTATLLLWLLALPLALLAIAAAFLNRRRAALIQV